MGMDINAVSNAAIVSGYSSNTDTGRTSSKETEKDTAKNISKNSDGVVYEKGDRAAKIQNTTYKVSKMTEEERAELVNSLKAENANRNQQLVDIVKQMMGQQAGAQSNVWKFLASGKFEVDAATKAQAQEDISEDGYYGVKNTSERLFDFAMALAGDDEENMKKMQAAVEKGYKLATHDWGKQLPDICGKTLDATNALFDEYFKSKKNTND